jgi:hypothetical protein
MRDRRTEGCADPPLGRLRALRVCRVQHGNDGDGAGAVEPGPLAVNERLLHGRPVARIGCGRVGICGQAVVDQLQKLAEFFKIDAHLVDELGERHLLRGG